MSDVITLMSAEEIDRALSRIAHQVLEYTAGAGDLALVGIHSRGVPLAHRLARKIGQADEGIPPVGILDINMYRDDLSSLASPVVRRTELPFKVDEKQVVLVDDVLYTGRTTRAALDALMDLGRPKAIRLAVLIDRGARELPIQPDFCGRSFTVQPDQIIEVRLAEMDGGADEVVVRRLGEPMTARHLRAAKSLPLARPGARVKGATTKPAAAGTGGRPARRRKKAAPAKRGRKAPKKRGRGKGGRR